MNDDETENNKSDILPAVLAKLDDVVGALNRDRQAQDQERQSQQRTQDSIRRSQWFIFGAAVASVIVASVYAHYSSGQLDAMRVANARMDIALGQANKNLRIANRMADVAEQQMRDSEAARIGQDAATAGSLRISEGNRLATEKVARATEEQAKVSRETLSIGDRAWVFLAKVVTNGKVGPGTPITVTLEFTNGGKTPAIDLYPSANLTCGPTIPENVDYSKMPPPELGGGDYSISVLGPGETPNPGIRTYQLTLDEIMWEAVKARKMILYATAYVTYRDIIGRSIHHTSVCTQYVPQSTLNPQDAWASCAKHNWMD